MGEQRSPGVATGDVVGDLLAGCAILDGEGLTSAFGHLSARTEQDEVRISASAGPGLVRDPAGLLTLDSGGAVRHGDPAGRPGETEIHIAILRNRPDVASVCRFHGPAAMAWSTLGRPLPATTGLALFLGHEVPCFDTSTTVTTPEHGDRLAACLGDRSAVLLRGFGAVTVAPSVARAVAYAWVLERSAQAVLAAAAVDAPLRYPAAAAEPFADPAGAAPAQLSRVWNYLEHRWAPRGDSGALNTEAIPA
jgi:ribulose-5-phosphate 4-epimerase/fuculose-1-phosphate aldolase